VNWIILAVLVLGPVVAIYVLKKWINQVFENRPLTFSQHDYSPELGKISSALEALNKQESALTTALEKVPTKVLNTIQGSVNTTTGKLGELIKFLELQRTYDRLIITGDIVDFLGIRFPKGDDPGAIEFIDIKTGDKAALNADQKKLRDLISKNKDVIAFKVVKVEIS